MLTYTQYGKQKSRKTRKTVWKMVTISPLISLLGSEDIGGYAVWGLSAGYNWKDTISIRVMW